MEATAIPRASVPDRVSLPGGKTIDTLRTEIVVNYRIGTEYSNRWEEKLWYAIDSNVTFPVRISFNDFGNSSYRRDQLLTRCGNGNEEMVIAK